MTQKNLGHSKWAKVAQKSDVAKKALKEAPVLQLGIYYHTLLILSISGSRKDNWWKSAKTTPFNLGGLIEKVFFGPRMYFLR